MQARHHTRSDHDALGRELKRANLALVRFICAGAPSDRTTKIADQLYNALLKARSRLDDEVCGLSDRDDDSAVRVYFGQPE